MYFSGACPPTNPCENGGVCLDGLVHECGEEGAPQEFICKCSAGHRGCKCEIQPFKKSEYYTCTKASRMVRLS